MEPVSTILTLALGYLLKGAAQSKAASQAKEELAGGFWNWVRPLFIKDVPELEEKPEDEETETKAHKKLLELVKDEKFFNQLAGKVAELQKAGIKEKNIVRQDIKRVKKIKIGDKEYSPDEQYDRKKHCRRQY